MICELIIPHGQNLKTNLYTFRYITKCPNCKTLIYRSPYSDDLCTSCYMPVRNKIKNIPSFIAARLRYYNSNYNCFGDDKDGEE